MEKGKTNIHISRGMGLINSWFEPTDSSFVENLSYPVNMLKQITIAYMMKYGKIK